MVLISICIVLCSVYRVSVNVYIYCIVYVIDVDIAICTLSTFVFYIEFYIILCIYSCVGQCSKPYGVVEKDIVVLKSRSYILVTIKRRSLCNSTI